MVLFAISFLVRFPYMNDGLFSMDEVATARAVEVSLSEFVLVGETNGRYGTVLLNLLLYVPYKAATGLSAEKVIVFTGILTGALTVSMLYLLVMELCGDRIASFLAALFLNFNLLFLVTSTTGKDHIHLLFFLILSLYLAAAGMKRGSARYKYAGFAAFSFAMAAHEAALAFVPVLLTFLFLFAPKEQGGANRTLLKDAAVFLLAAAIPFVLYIRGILAATLTTTGTGIVSYLGPFSPRLTVSAQELAEILGWPAIALGLIGIYRLLGNRRLLIFLSSWMALFFYFGNVSAGTERYMLFVLAAFLIPSAAGASFLVDKAGRWIPKAVLGAALALGICGYGFVKAWPAIDFRRSYSGPKETALYAGRWTERNAVIVTMDEGVFYEYYAGRKYLMHPIDDRAANDAFVGSLKIMAAQGVPLYTTSTTCSYDYDGYFRGLMQENFRFIHLGSVFDEETVRGVIRRNPWPNGLFRIVLK